MADDPEPKLNSELPKDESPESDEATQPASDTEPSSETSEESASTPDPAQKPVVGATGRSKKGKKWLLIILALAVLIAGGVEAYAYKHQRDADLKAKQTQQAEAKAQPALNFFTFVAAQDNKQFTVGINTQAGKSLLTKTIPEVNSSYLVKPDHKLVINASINPTTNQAVFRRISKTGDVKELVKYQLPASTNQEHPYFNAYGFIGQTGSFIADLPADSYNSQLVKIDGQGQLQTILKEDQDTVYQFEGLSPDGKSLFYSAVSAKGESCGGDTTIKLPDYTGPVYELLSYDLKTGTSQTVVKDERQPTATDKVEDGLRPEAFSSDGKTVYSRPGVHGGCRGAGVPTLLWATDLTTKETKRIPIDYAWAWTSAFGSQAKYAVYSQPAKDNQQDGDHTKALLINLQSGKQQLLTTPGNGKQDLIASTAILINGQDEFIFTGDTERAVNGTASNTNRQAIALLNPTTGRFEHYQTLPVIATDDPKCSVYFEPLIIYDKLAISSGCGAALLDLKTNKITTIKAPNHTTAVLY